MKNLKFDGRYKDDILTGRKRATIRLGRKINLRPGEEVLIHAGGYVLGKARITRVETKTVSELTDEDARKDGFRNRDELIEALREHYKFVKPNSPATIVEFEMTKVLDKPILSADFPYEGNNPIEIAEKALEYLDNLSFEEVALLKLFLKEGSLRKAAMKLGGLNKRYKIREVLRKAYEELKKRGIMEPKI
ncbi:ASCH domain-containing protein [Pyrococcus sp. ST04]|uniref:ASCH domain-containing protein n=1 Tax=Pyrococcus sp. ST04 TaxID=1183377 RepID=UPI00026058DD|nr:ASCH domain-containing protein [Pyrococcus sp. ST04]AFK22237.1 hypothetical protein Py04_0635 [Pyrococcus sp. ST04]